MSWADQEEIYDRLDRLGEHETVSSFALAFYELISDHLAGEGESAQAVRLCFVEFLEVIERYHRALDLFASEQQVTLGNVRSAAEKRDIGLRVLLERLSVDQGRGEVEIGRLLLTAECYYQLAEVERVVERLEAAVRAGADDPLVQFALGYNRFELATQAFTRYDPKSGEREVHDEDRFRLLCLSAVSSFQEGLSGTAFDAQLHWWIGNVLRSAGFEDAADASFAKAKEIMGQPGNIDEPFGPPDDLGLELNRESEYDRARSSGPITEDEVRQAAMLLRRSYSASDILKG